METKTEAPLGSSTEPVEGKTEPPADESVDAVGGSVEDKPAAPAQQARPQITYPNHLLQAVITIALLLAMFLVALDMSIIATAIPTITVQFHSVNQVGWYGSAFFIGLAAFQAFWGRAYKFFPLKIAFLACIATFEIGSLIVALAQNSTTIIVGRAIQGAGGAGITGGAYTICAFITQPKHLAPVMGLFGVVWSCSSVLGPVLGGIFTQDVSWRWCFWINLPIGGATMLIILIFFKTPAWSRMASTTPKEIPLAFDFPGMAIFLGAFVCIFLVLQDGGISRSWSSSVVIGLFVGFGLLLIVFSIIEWKQGERAMIVGRIQKRRSILACSVFTFLINAGSFARVYNLPIYFQAVQGVSPSESGIRTLPSVLTISLFSLLGSAAVGRVGYYQPFLLVGGIFATVGSAMIYTLDLNSPASHWIGYQVLAGIGTGITVQLPVIVAQAISTRPDMSVTVGIALFYQFVGGALGVSSAQSIMNNRLIAALPPGNPAVSGSTVLAAGAQGLRVAFSNPNDLLTVVQAYMTGLKDAWIWSIALSAAATLGALGAEWKSINADAVKARNAAKAAATVQAA